MSQLALPIRHHRLSTTISFEWLKGGGAEPEADAVLEQRPDMGPHGEIDEAVVAALGHDDVDL